MRKKLTPQIDRATCVACSGSGRNSKGGKCFPCEGSGRKKRNSKTKVSSEPSTFWKGPQHDGITFSLLSRWLVCPERFRLLVVEGLQEDEGFNHAIEYGSMWHEAEEALAGGNPWLPAMRNYRDKLLSRYQGSEQTINKWFMLAKAQFPCYIEYWENDPVTRKRKPIFEEEDFKVKYTLPSGRWMYLRGKWDCVLRIGTSIYLQENKTKGKIDREGIGATLERNLQAMLYMVSLETAWNGKDTFAITPDHSPRFSKIPSGSRLTGILYNVVRRPLSDRYPLRQKKGETLKAFAKRMAIDIQKNPDNHFMRWRIAIRPPAMERFKRENFHPLLERFLDWWEYIAEDPYNPWRKPQGIHFMAPWGVYNSLASGFRGDYFELLTKGSKAGLRKIDTLFPELEEPTTNGKTSDSKNKRNTKAKAKAKNIPF